MRQRDKETVIIRYRSINRLIFLILLGSALFHQVTAASITREGSNLATTAVTSGTFLSQWDTILTSPGSSFSQQIRLPLESSGSYNFTVDWGDGINNTITSWDQAEVIHSYASAGVYTIAIAGTLVGWRFNNGGDRLKIIEISQWGNIRLGNSDSYFDGSSNLRLKATDALNLTGTTTLFHAFRRCINLGIGGNMSNWDVSSVTDMGGMFQYASSFNQPISNWNVSSVIDMSFMFNYAYSFNQPIDNWNVSSVTNMGGMFNRIRSFNQSIGNWDVTNVTDMSFMFWGASFNQDINDWNVSSVTDMRGMFTYALSFNQLIGNWNVSSVTDMSYMFSYASSFNQPIGNWDVSSVSDMTYMFYNASPFNQPISDWNVSSVTDMSFMFWGASFNQPISDWNVSSVTNMGGMFAEASSFNQPIGNWNVSDVTDMRYMFYNASSFNQPISDWNVSDVTDMRYMFSGALSFNQSIGNWDVSSVARMREMFSGTSSFNQPIDNWNVSNVTNMGSMFSHARSFNQPIDNWNVSNVTNMGSMFSHARSFNQPIGNWDVSSVTGMSSMFSGVTLSISNYNNLLKGWASLSLQPGVSFDGGNSLYTDNTSRQYIIDTFSWEIIDGGFADFSAPEINSPEDISYKFASTRNEIIWNVKDLNPDVYNVTKDGALYISDTLWSNGLIRMDIDGLDVGEHVFIIYVYDTEGNMVSDTVIITVYANQTNTKIDFEGLENLGLSLLVLIIVIISIIFGLKVRSRID